MFRRVQYTDYLWVYNKSFITSGVIEGRKTPYNDLLIICLS